MSNKTQWAEDGPFYNSENHCRCSIAGRTAGTMNEICRGAFGPEWDYGGDWHSHDCEDLGPFEQCVDQGTPQCKHARYSSDSSDNIKKNCCLTNGTVKYSKRTTCNPVHTNSNNKECRSIMKTYCEQPANFFKDQCKTWLINLGTDAIKDEVANKICPTVKDIGTPGQKAFCACYNVKIPEKLKDRPELLGQLLCLSDDCAKKGTALQPAQQYGLECPINNVVCSMTDVIQQAYDSGSIGSGEIGQNCGIEISSDGKIIEKRDTSDKPYKSDEPDKPDLPKETGPNKTLIAVIIGIIFLFLIIIAGVMLIK